MKTSVKLVIIGFCLYVSPLVANSKQEIVAKVTLFPIGSFEATSDKIIGTGKKSGVRYSADSLRVPLASVKTGIALRDQHMREKLLEKQHPDIVVTDIKASAGKGTAKLSMRGVTKPISFTYKDFGDGTAEAKFTVHLPDFKIEGINFKGVGVEDDMEVVAKISYQNK